MKVATLVKNIYDMLLLYNFPLCDGFLVTDQKRSVKIFCKISHAANKLTFMLNKLYHVLYNIYMICSSVIKTLMYVN